MAKPRRSFCLLVNASAAGDGRLRETVREFREGGWQVEVRPLWESGQARQFAAEAVKRGVFDVIIAAGGDGTLNEVVNGVMAAAPDDPPTVGVLPYGTANDFAIGIGMPTDDPAAGLRLIARGRPRRIDLGRVDDRWFINAASIGFNAEITADTSKVLKQLLGGAAYSVTALGKLTAGDNMASRHTRVTIDPIEPGQTTADLNWEGDLLMLIVANARTAGGGYTIAPDARLDDGLLDVTLIANAPASELAGVFASLFSASGQSAHPPAVRQCQAARLALDATQSLRLNLDGESLEVQRCRIDVRPSALPVVMAAEPG